MVPRTAGIRHVEIGAPSARGELRSVVRASMGIAFFAWLYAVSASTTAVDGRSGPSKNLLPFQVVVQDRGVEDQRMFRELRVALIEAQNVRSLEGRWPDVPALAEQGIDPFVPDPTRRGARHQWRMERDGYTVRYVGTPDREEASAWLVLIQEADPSLPREPYQDDEEHARLLDGTPLHVSVWCHDSGRRATASAVRLPQNAGWTQVFAAGPSTIH